MRNPSNRKHRFHHCLSILSAVDATGIWRCQKPRMHKLIYTKKMNSRKRDPKLWLHTTYISFIQMIFPRYQIVRISVIYHCVSYNCNCCFLQLSVSNATYHRFLPLVPGDDFCLNSGGFLWVHVAVAPQ